MERRPDFLKKCRLRYPLNSQRLLGTQSRPSAFSLRIHAWGRQPWIAKIESGAASDVRFSKTCKAGASIRAQEEPLRPNTILRALEESVARRYGEVQIWP